MNTNALEQDNLSARLYRILARGSLVSALSIVVYFAFYAVAGTLATDNPLGQPYGGLWQAVRSPVVYRLAWVSESLSWLLVGATLIIFAVLFARRAPISAAFVAACGIGQLSGSLGSFLLSGVSALATRYVTAAANQQPALLQSFLDLRAVIGSPAAVGSLLQGTGFLLIAWVAWEWVGFPRWLAVWLAIPGLIGLVLFLLLVIDGPTVPMVAMLTLHDVGLVGLYLAVAVRFWSPSGSVVSDASAPAAT